MSYYPPPFFFLLHSNHTGLLAVPYNPQTCSHLLSSSFTAAIRYSFTWLAPSLLSGLCSKETLPVKTLLTPLKNTLHIPSSTPALVFLFPFAFFTLCYLPTSDTLYTCLLFNCLPHPTREKLLEGKNFVLFTAIPPAWVTNSSHSICICWVKKWIMIGLVNISRCEWNHVLMDSCKFFFNSGVNFAYHNCINHFIRTKQNNTTREIHKHFELFLVSSWHFYFYSLFSFLDILIFCFYSYFENLWISLTYILYSYLEYWHWPCSHYTHPCMFFPAPSGFSGSHFGYPLEYLERLKKYKWIVPTLVQLNKNLWVETQALV